ncbi:MAG: feruloyl esterase [Pseudonocardiales bacterium]|nr:feruloyl esterase [Pseudonocardiales bacterium]
MARNVWGLALLIGAGALARPALAADCAAIAKMQLADTEITRAAPVAAGSFTPETPNAAAIPNLPGFCRVAATLKPTPSSNIRVELWLPESDWNGYFEGTGNGGYAGGIIYAELASGLQLGFAVANTDMGTAPATTYNAVALADASEKWVDFGWRSTHLMTEFGKRVVAEYYGRSATHAVFSGCSTGGGQGLHEAQRFPDDYDGIIAGAPAENRTHVHTDILWDYVRTHGEPPAIITAETAALVTKAVVAACGPASGSLPTDPFLTDPRTCRFDPVALQCKDGESGTCLTPPQVQALREVYDGPRNPRTHASIYPGVSPGGESGSFYALPALDGAAPPAAAPPNEPMFDGLFAWALGKDWNWRSFDFDRDMATVDAKLGKDLNANSADLRRFAAHGGKLIMYHGWADALVVPQDGVNYYRRVVASAGGSDALQRTQRFARLFMVPGMGHCFGGPGPNSFGGWFHQPVADDAEHNILLALKRWVDHGAAPDRIVATKFTGDKPSGGVAMSRPLCPYPAVARYKGTGNSNAADSFECSPGPAVDNPEAAAEYLR